ncbi:hypothetical protein IG631_04474 [Alternaria alternata]|nr:hypothetical protein IG631_04474 [Alternaria alternata]
MQSILHIHQVGPTVFELLSHIASRPGRILGDGRDFLPNARTPQNARAACRWRNSAISAAKRVERSAGGRRNNDYCRCKWVTVEKLRDRKPVA